MDSEGRPGRYRLRGQNDCEKRASRNSPSLAVALNCGMGSSSLNADVNAFERLQIVRGRNSSYFGWKYRSCTVRARCLGASSSPLHKRLVDDHLGGDVGEFAFLPGFHLLSHRLKASLHSVDTNRNAVNERERLRVFREHRGKHAWNNASELTWSPHRTGSIYPTKWNASGYASSGYASYT